VWRADNRQRRSAAASDRHCQRDEMADGEPKVTVLFDASHKERYSLETGGGLKKVKARLRAKGLDAKSLKDEVTPASLSAARVVAIVGPRSKFTQNEVDALKGFMEEGGSILITLGEGGESTNDTNINYFLEDFGIAITTMRSCDRRTTSGHTRRSALCRRVC